MNLRYKILIISILGYFLVISCSMEKSPSDFPYNSRCDYAIKGTIFNADSTVLANVKVKMYEITSDLPPKNILRDSCLSNTNGFYEVRNNNVIPFISNTYELYFVDLNALYKDTSIMVIFTNENFTNSNNAYFLGETFWELNMVLEN